MHQLCYITRLHVIDNRSTHVEMGACELFINTSMRALHHLCVQYKLPWVRICLIARVWSFPSFSRFVFFHLLAFACANTFIFVSCGVGLTVLFVISNAIGYFPFSWSQLWLDASEKAIHKSHVTWDMALSMDQMQLSFIYLFF